MLHLALELALILQAQGVKHVIADFIAAVGDDHHFVFLFRQPPRQHLILGLHQLLIVNQRLEGIHPFHIALGHAVAGGQGGVHHIAHAAGFHHRGGVHLHARAIVQDAVNGQGRGVIILNAAYQRVHTGIAAVQKPLEGSQVVLLDFAHHGGHHLRHHIAGIDFVHVVLLCFPRRAHHGIKHGGHIHRLLFDGQRIGGQGILLHAGDIRVNARGQGQNQRNANNADGTGEGRQDGAALLGHQVVQRQGQGGQKAHGGLFLGLLLFFQVFLLRRIGIGIRLHPAVQQTDNPGGVLIRQLGIMGDHNHQLFLGNLLENFHYLHTGFAVQRAGGLIRQQDFRVVHQRPGDGHPLHLAAAHLAGLLFQLIAQAHLFQRRDGPLPPLRLAHAGQRQRQLHIGQHRLMGNQIIALEHEADGVVAIGIPIAVAEFLGGAAGNQKIAAGILIQPADNVQQRGFPAAGRAQNRCELAGTKPQINPPQGLHPAVSRLIILDNLFQFQHIRLLSAPRPRNTSSL